MNAPHANTDDDDAAPRPDDAPLSTPRPRNPWLIATLVAVVGIPAVVTGIGAITSPPEGRVPVGHIVYLDADQPSEKTTMLRGMYRVGPDGIQQEIVHEQEPQDIDAGAREWIAEPAESPDGRHIAFIKQLITILEERQSDDYQLWVVDVPGPGSSGPAQNEDRAAGRCVLDLNALRLSRATRLVWSPDSRRVAFLDPHAVQIVDIASGKLSTIPAAGTLAAGSGPHGIPYAFLLAYPSDLKTPAYCLWLTHTVLWGHVVLNNVTEAALSPDGSRLAIVRPTAPAQITLVSPTGEEQVLRAPSGWSLFGGRRVMSVRWSPDGAFLAYTVSKPPVAEDEMFTLDVATGSAHKLPMRTGGASWDWGP
ncbi:MAG: hypothetical protein ACLQVD_10640 [Capsulimonadaceae bacterium]